MAEVQYTGKKWNHHGQKNTQNTLTQKKEYQYQLKLQKEENQTTYLQSKRNTDNWS